MSHRYYQMPQINSVWTEQGNMHTCKAINGQPMETLVTQQQW